MPPARHRRTARPAIAALALAGAASLLLVACTSHSDFAAAAGRRDLATIPARLALALPTDAAPVSCTAVAAGAPARPLALDLSFRDDFDQLDLGRKDGWLPHFNLDRDPATGAWRGYDLATNRTLVGNHEQQIYVDPGYAAGSGQPLGLDPFRIDHGVLSIVAERVRPEHAAALHGFDFSSGMLSSRASFVQRYGYFEMRARVPAGRALWPAFWLLPTERVWPPEIDVLEVVGQKPDLMVTTVHASDAPGGKHRGSGCRTHLPDATENFHLFGALWTPARITWYIDRRPVAEIATPAGFDRPMYLLLNLAVGGSMVGRADIYTPTPARFEIDWVAAWKLADAEMAAGR